MERTMLADKMKCTAIKMRDNLQNIDSTFIFLLRKTNGCVLSNSIGMPKFSTFVIAKAN